MLPRSRVLSFTDVCVHTTCRSQYPTAFYSCSLWFARSLIKTSLNYCYAVWTLSAWVHLKCSSLTGPSKSFIFSVCKNNVIIVLCFNVSQTKSEACTLEAVCLLIMYISVYRHVQPGDSVVDPFKLLLLMLLQKQTKVKAGLQHIVGSWSLSAPYHVWLRSHSPTAGAE